MSQHPHQTITAAYCCLLRLATLVLTQAFPFVSLAPSLCSHSTASGLLLFPILKAFNTCTFAESRSIMPSHLLVVTQGLHLCCQHALFKLSERVKNEREVMHSGHRVLQMQVQEV